MRLIALFLLCPCMLFSQQKIDAEQFFTLSTQAQPTFTTDNLKTVRFPWIEEVEFRSETRDFEWVQQQYTLRVTPSTLGKRKAQKALYSQLKNKPDFGGQEYQCEKSADIQADWLSLYLIHQKTSILKKLKMVREDQQTIYEKLAGTYDFDFRKLITLQTDKSDLTIAIHRLQLEKKYIFDKYGIPNQELDFQDFISVEKISGMMLSDPLVSLSVPDPKTTYEKELIIKELALEKAEKRQIFDFAQVQYRGPHEDFVNEKISVGIGIRLPNSGNDKLKIKELQFDQINIEKEEERDKIALQTKVDALQSRLNMNIQAYTFFEETLTAERTQLQNIGNQISRKEGFDPLSLLDIEERNISSMLKAFKLKEDILFDYLEYLEETQQVCDGAVGNWR